MRIERRRIGQGLCTATLWLAACAGDSGRGGVGTPEAAVATTPVSTAAVLALPGLYEPFVATKPTTPAEDEALRAAADDFATRTDEGLAGLAPLERFVAAHPHSGWTASVLVNLGLGDYHAGYFSRAMAAYEQAFREGRSATDWKAKALVDRALGELAKMHARVGHASALEALFADAGDRPISGPATELVTGAREGIWQMRNNPGVAYLCGPKALKNALAASGKSPAAVAFLDEQRSGPRGFSLAALDALASRAGVAHRIVHRAPGQAVPVPSVIHWNVSHYAAIVGQEGERYHVVDPTFGGDLTLSRDAIDAEGSGFFLVPKAAAQDPAWRDATPAEAAATYGMGFTNNAAPGGNNSQAPKASGGKEKVGTQNAKQPGQTTAKGCPRNGVGMCAPDAHLMSVSLNLNDTPVGYTPPVGPPVYVRLTYNQREEVDPYGPPAVPTYTNVGPKWTLNVLSWVEDSPTSNGGSVTRYLPEGGAFAYAGYSTATGNFTPELQTGAVLSRAPLTGAATSYTLTGTDGSKLVYAQADGATAYPRRLFLTSIVDAQGNALTLSYGKTPVVDGGVPIADGGVVACPAGACTVLTAIADANGRSTTFGYGLEGNPLLVTVMTDPFGRSAKLTYDASARLVSITDVLGITSSLEYDDADAQPSFISALKTPYGTTRFTGGETLNSSKQVASRFLETTDPLGATERIEFMEQAPGIDASEAAAVVPVGMPVALTNNYMQYRNTFYWDKSSYLQYGTGATKDYTRARRWHWLHTAASNTSPMVESILDPLESRIWFASVGQSNSYTDGTLYAPTAVGRVLDDGSTQLTTTTYNVIGKPLTSNDPLGRTRRFTYAANNIDLLTVEQEVATSVFVTIARFTYNAQHLPMTATDAASQTTSYGYNTAGQLTSVTDPLERVTSYSYDDRGRLTNVTDANGVPVLKLAYDDQDRVKTQTNATGYAVGYEYDAFDRVTKLSFPDGTTQLYDWTFQSGANAGGQSLELRAVTDRMSHKTSYDYDAAQRLVSVADPLSQVVKYGYYPNGGLHALTDQNGNITTWDVDLEGRPTAKHYALGPASTITYEKTTSRVKSVADGRSQTTTYAYNVDDTVAGITYPAGTAPVSFQYDRFIPRRTSMTDQFGQTTYIYYPLTGTPILGAGRLQSIVSSVAGGTGSFDTISYGYDELGRVVAKQVNDATETVEYDTIGRTKSVANALDTFAYQYADETARVTAIASTNGPKVAFGYYGATGDNLLKQISYTGPSAAPLSQFGYEYDAAHNVTRFFESYVGQKLAAPPDGGTMGLVTPPAKRGGERWWFIAAVLLALATVALARNRERRARFARVARPLALGALFVSCGGGGHQNGGGGMGGMSDVTGEGGAGGRVGPTPTVSDAAVDGPEAPPNLGPAQLTAYSYDAADRLLAARVGTDAAPPLPAATPRFAYVYDPASNLTSITANGSTRTFGYSATNAIQGANYDLNGSLTALEDAVYTWDGANRLASVTKGNSESDFSYDGLSRMVRIVEKQGGAVVADHAYTWCGDFRCLEHDNAKRGAPVSKKYFHQGFVIGEKKYFSINDRLRSTRQVTDDKGTVQAQYDYDPFGARRKVGGDGESDQGFAGLFHHSSSGLDLAVYRPYAADQGRWLARDPAGEAGGVNLYGYALGNPVGLNDPLGLTASCPASLQDMHVGVCYADAPEGFVPYGGASSVYHCGGQVFLEKRSDTQSAVTNPIAECVYDVTGGLIDDNHPYRMCQGTPDQYPYYGLLTNPMTSWNHLVNDSGGPSAVLPNGQSLGTAAKEESRRFKADYESDPEGVKATLRLYHSGLLRPPRNMTLIPLR